MTYLERDQLAFDISSVGRDRRLCGDSALKEWAFRTCLGVVKTSLLIEYLGVFYREQSIRSETCAYIAKLSP